MHAPANAVRRTSRDHRCTITRAFGRRSTTSRTAFARGILRVATSVCNSTHFLQLGLVSLQEIRTRAIIVEEAGTIGRTATLPDDATRPLLTFADLLDFLDELLVRDAPVEKLRG